MLLKQVGDLKTDLLSDHVDSVLDTAVRDDRENTGIHNTEVLDTVNLELTVDDTLRDVLGETGSTARVCVLSQQPTSKCLCLANTRVVCSKAGAKRPCKPQGEIRTETGLATLQNLPTHLLIIITGHSPGVVLANDVLHTLTIKEDIINKANTFAHGNDVEVIAKEVQVDIRLLKRISRVELHLAVLGERAEEIDDNGEPVTFGRSGKVPLEGIGKHGLV